MSNDVVVGEKLVGYQVQRWDDDLDWLEGTVDGWGACSKAYPTLEQALKDAAKKSDRIPGRYQIVKVWQQDILVREIVTVEGET